MIQTGIESKVKIQDIIENQLPSFILEDNPNAVEFFKQYYLSQEYQGGPTDLADNLDQYLKVDNLTPEVVVDKTTTSVGFSAADTTINVSSTKGFPDQYGLLKVEDEIITYTGKTANSFTGCIRGFSGITSYRDPQDITSATFESTKADSHSSGVTVKNLSSLFLKEFYRKTKATYTPGLENTNFNENLDVGLFIKNAKNFYQSKGTDESIKILFKVLYGEEPSVINLENYLIKPSGSRYVRREIVIAEPISGNPINIKGQTLFKETDSETNASISFIEPFTIAGKLYYKLELFVGSDENQTVFGNFKVTPVTKVIENVSIGSSVVTVDSTIGFPKSGNVICGNNNISYTEKTINQFFGCDGIESDISSSDNLRSLDVYSSYENGDTTKKVRLIIHGSIRNLRQLEEVLDVAENDKIAVRSLGDNILNNSDNYKEIFANSWIYNTSARYQITNISNFTLGSSIDKSSLKIGDEVEFLERNSLTPIASIGKIYIKDISTLENRITPIGAIPTLDPNKNYDVRRKLNTASTVNIPIEYDSVTTDITNVYSDGNEYMYVASNSLPSNILPTSISDNINTNTYRLSIDTELKKVAISSFVDEVDGFFTTFDSPDPIPFENGDRVIYDPVGTPLFGLEPGSYYVKSIKGDATRFQLVTSLSFVESSNIIEFRENDQSAIHNFRLYDQRSGVIKSQQLLKKFPLEKNIKLGSDTKTSPGTVGLLINGVEITNYKSKDTMYFGPLSEVQVLNSGENYDVINPPKIDIVSNSTTDAEIRPVISGSIENVYVDPQEYDIDGITSINISGGNGSGAVIEPILSKQSREVTFNASNFTSGGGVSTVTNQIVFTKDHYFVNGEEVIYNTLGNEPITIGAGTSNLSNNGRFFVQVDNNTTVQLYSSLEDQIKKNNPIEFKNGGKGFQKFLTAQPKNKISSIKVIDGGSGYTNRKLSVTPSDVSTTRDLITFKNHNFESGDVVEYTYDEVSIGISTENQYIVVKNDENSFRLCDAGIGGTITENFENREFVSLTQSGIGYQNFKYPDISVSINYFNVGFGTTTQVQQTISTTPVVRGGIIDAYLIKSGTGYGSTTINFEKKPIVNIQNGVGADIIPVVTNGVLVDVNISSPGSEYFSVPDLEVVGSGAGAQLRAIVSDGKIVEVKVLRGGSGYQGNTKINVISAGTNGLIGTRIRSLNVNHGKGKFNDGNVVLETENGLQYSVTSYIESFRDAFGEASQSNSGIIGWAYDGHPIYGPFGPTNPEDLTSTTKELESGYILDSSSVADRPVGFIDGFFVEDYKFNDSGDLDKHNGRYEKTKEFPNGTYVYHATLESDVPSFPYFIGDSFNSESQIDVLLNQSKFDFTETNLLRNTFPYKLGEKESGYDFTIKPRTQKDQSMRIESISRGSVDSITINNEGLDFKVNDTFTFTSRNGAGSALKARVSSVKGEKLSSIDNINSTYSSNPIEWESGSSTRVYILPSHDFTNNTKVTISGFSTSMRELNGQFNITLPSLPDSRCISTISADVSVASTEIYVSSIPSEVSVGSTIIIGPETLSVLGIYPQNNILRVDRGQPGTSHTVGTAVTFKADSFIISNNIIDKFDSRKNKKVYFNPTESVGLGTVVGLSTSVTFDFGTSSVTRSIPARAIYIENHPFKTNDKISYTQGGSPVGISTDGETGIIDLTNGTYYVNVKSPSLIGIKTDLTGPELFFHYNGSDKDTYLFETQYSQKLATVETNETTVSVSTSHGLKNGDVISLTVEPNLSVGIGTSTQVRVLYKNEKLVVNPIGFNSTGINSTTNEITITNHGLETGDKVFYEDNTFDSWIETSDQIDTTTEDSDPHAIHFKPDGTKMYIVGRSANEVNEYILSTPWSISTASFVSNFSVSSEGTNPRGLYIRDDGLKFWTCDKNTDEIYQYSMSTAWDISTASYDNVSLFVGSGSPLGITQLTPTGIYFKYDGSVLYLIGDSPDSIRQFDLSTPWDITTASYSGTITGRLDVNPPDAVPQDIHINSSGTLVYWVGSNLNNIYIYELSTPWDITTGTELSRISLGTGTATLIYVSPDEQNLYVVKSTTDILYRFNRPSPLTGSEYYIAKIDEERFNLCETYFDTQKTPPTVVSFASTGGSIQTISKINPRLRPIKNNNLKFDLSDSSVSGYKLKFYKDSDFTNEFVSVGSSSEFTVSGVGTVRTLKNVDEISGILYYTLEKDGEKVKTDNFVINNSEILAKTSEYEDSYSISNVTDQTFVINLNKKPERDSYEIDECDKLEYSTTSEEVKGSIDKISIDSKSFGYNQLPQLASINSESGRNLSLNLNSNSIGVVNDILIDDFNFIYPSDNTLSPSARISPTVVVSANNKVGFVTVLDGGSGYTEVPNIVVVGKEDRIAYDNGVFDVKVTGSVISNVDIISSPNGIESNDVEVFTTDNSNGISIVSVDSSNSGIFTCQITTPTINGITSFTTQPFEIGDKVFVEGIQKYGSDGDGFNSADYGYRFFEVLDYIVGASVNDQVKISIGEYGTNTGIAITDQNSFGLIINKKDYPSFTSSVITSKFILNEQLSVDNNLVDLFVSEVFENRIKVFGTYNLRVGDIIRGSSSGDRATIKTLKKNEAVFDVDYSYPANIGWTDEIGRLSEDFQVIADNDYYQNLSYSIKSSITYEKQQSSISNLTHISGLKNFADTGISSVTSDVGITSVSDETTLVRDLIRDDLRVDTIYGFDLVQDIDVLNNSSKFITLKRVKLTDFIELLSNDVLKIDDLSPIFSSSEAANTEFATIMEISDSDDYQKFLLYLNGNNGTHLQLTSLTILQNKENAFISEIEHVSNIDPVNTELVYGSYDLMFSDDGERLYLRFVPENPFDFDYTIKVIKQTFNTSTDSEGTKEIGHIDMIGDVETKSVGIGSTQIYEVDVAEYDSLVITSQVIDIDTKNANFVTLYVTNDGTNSYLSEYYSDAIGQGILVGSQIGNFSADLSANKLRVDFENDSSVETQIKSNIIGFGVTDVTGDVVGHRFSLPGQSAGSERSAIYQAGFSTARNSSETILSYDRNLFNSSHSTIEVGFGATKAIHQVMTIDDGVNVFTQQSPFMSSIDNDNVEYSGIGTFEAEVNGLNIDLKFYPNSPDSTNEDINISVLSKLIYEQDDTSNIYPSLIYGPITEEMFRVQYNSINGDRIDRTSFPLTSNLTPIFEKVFRPADPNVISYSTGTFNIENHFFVTGQELRYVPGSTFVGTGVSAMRYNANDEFPSTVYAIKINDNSFKVATSLANANAGTGITVATVGEGNAHKFVSDKQNSKCLITVNGLVQYPLAQTKLSYTLDGAISVGTTIFPLTGISTINPQDVLKIDDEFMNVINVGLGTTSVGPITNVGSETLVEVERGFVGSAATNHSNSSEVLLHKGAFNIVDNNIHFTAPPRGNPELSLTRDDSNLEPPKSDFGGRVFLRSDYSTNKVYDDISDEFTGIGRTFTLKTGLANTTGIGTAFLFVNNIFQTPSTINNAGNNYSLVEDSVAGITSVIFTGLKNPESPFNILTFDEDINRNETPRGGVIISLGSTSGLGFAPLVGAQVVPVVSGGAINSLIGFATFTSDLGISTTSYDEKSGVLEVTTGTNHNLKPHNEYVYLEDLEFSCSAEHAGITTTIFPDGTIGNVFPVTGIVSETTFNVKIGVSTIPHAYVGSGSAYPYYGNANFGSGYNGIVSIGVSVFEEGHTGTPANITATVGAGGTIIFNIVNAGAGYTNPQIFVSDPSYENLEVIGISRLSTGVTTETGTGLRLDLEVSPSSEPTGIGSTLFIVSDFKIKRNGYGFRKGDVFKAVGLVTDKSLNAPITEAEFTVLETYSDSFSAWNLGELDFIDSISNLQDGSRKRFPLFYNNDLLSFESSSTSNITNNLSNLLVIFINGILQNPGETYVFEGGTSFIFDTAPKVEDDVAIYFYTGNRSVDININTNVNPSIERGDVVQIRKSSFSSNSIDQDSRIVTDLSFSDKFETNKYVGPGIVTDRFLPMSLTKQKSEFKVNGELIFKTRDSIEAQINPIAKIIKDVSTTDNEIFVDNAELFAYGLDLPTNTFNCIVIDPLTGINTDFVESIKKFNTVQGFSGSITGIGTTSGSGSHPLALKFTINSSTFANMVEGNPIYIFNTTQGDGITSVDDSDSNIVSVGNTFTDNIYYISEFSSNGTVGILTCNIKSDSDVTGIDTTGSTSNPVGNYSWGKLTSNASIQRSSSPISIGVSGLTASSGLSTYPIIQRRDVGLRNSGALPKIIL